MLWRLPPPYLRQPLFYVTLCNKIAQLKIHKVLLLSATRRKNFFLKLLNSMVINRRFYPYTGGRIRVSENWYSRMFYAVEGDFFLKLLNSMVINRRFYPYTGEYESVKTGILACFMQWKVRVTKYYSSETYFGDVVLWLSLLDRLIQQNCLFFF